jgi:Regulatory P domain of the subtilisin-like proprotein convertases and other proteases
MEPRPQDDCKTGFVDWSILTLKHWGEDPVGEWKFEIFDTVSFTSGVDTVVGLFINLLELVPPR